MGAILICGRSERRSEMQRAADDTYASLYGNDELQDASDAQTRVRPATISAVIAVMIGASFATAE